MSVKAGQAHTQQPPAAVGPVALGLEARTGLEPKRRINLVALGPKTPDPAGKRGVGAGVPEFADLPKKRGRPKLRAELQTPAHVGELGLGEPGWARPGSVAGWDLGGGITASRPPVHAELPGQPGDRPPVGGVERVHHQPVLLTLHPSLLSRAGVDTVTLAGGTPLFQQHQGPEELPRGLCTFCDQNCALSVIANKPELKPRTPLSRGTRDRS